jgi:beta-lactamase superfamily II metal-dependent hydrolase
MSWMRFVVLDVGQGSANVVERYDDMDRLTSAALIDVGSEQWKRLAGGPSVDWLAGRLQQMVGGAKLEAVVLSHSDSDHINLVPNLLRLFDTPRTIGPTKPVLTIEEVYYGGDYARYKKGKGVRSRNIIERLDEYRPLGVDRNASVYALADDWTSFEGDDPADFHALCWIGAGEIPLWVLTSNTTAGYALVGDGSRKRRRIDLSGGYGINTRSIVVATVFRGRTLIATGDATGLTLASCNRALSGADAREVLHLPALMVTAPHHGSDTTTYDLTGSSHGSEEAKRVVRTFAAYAEAMTLTASAGERATFKHPAGTVVSDLGAHMAAETLYIDPALTDDDEHFATLYWHPKTATLVGGTKPKWPDTGGWYTSRTWRNLYTTDYFNAPARRAAVPTAYPWRAFAEDPSVFAPAPPKGIAWAYEVATDGSVQMKVARSRAQGDPAFWAAVERIHGPLPPDGFVWVPSAHQPQPVVRMAGDEPVRAPGSSARRAPRPADRDTRPRTARQRPAPAPEPAPAPPRARRARQIP